MKPTDPLSPYKNLFITARPGMGASTLVANIVNKYLDEGKKCLIFDSETRAFLSYIERAKIIKENTNIDSVRSSFMFEKYGNLTVMFHPIIGLDDGIFRSVHRYDENYINVMSEARFKKLSLSSEN